MDADVVWKKKEIVSPSGGLGGPRPFGISSGRSGAQVVENSRGGKISPEGRTMVPQRGKKSC